MRANLYSIIIVYEYNIQWCFARRRVKAAVEANARKKRKIIEKAVYEAKGPSQISRLIPDALKKLIMTTDCVYVINGRRYLNHDYGNA